jgi:hypothetical protein
MIDLTGGLTKRLLDWLGLRWDKRPVSMDLAQDYKATFSTLAGQRVLRHLLDNIYCRTYEGTDVQMAAAHNYRRTVIQEILENIDRAEAIDKPVPVEKGDTVNG